MSMKTQPTGQSVGKSCIRFKKLEDLNMDVARELVKAAPKYALGA